MTYKIHVAIAFAALTLAAGVVHAETPTAPQYSKTELKQMIEDAHSAQQYQALAAYYRQRQQDFEQKAQAEKVEWDRRSQITTGIAEKYPRPVDSSRNRYEYFNYEAQQMDQQAAHYESLSGNRSQ